jgi:hypothetical protein
MMSGPPVFIRIIDSTFALVSGSVPRVANLTKNAAQDPVITKNMASNTIIRIEGTSYRGWGESSLVGVSGISLMCPGYRSDGEMEQNTLSHISLGLADAETVARLVTAIDGPLNIIGGMAGRASLSVVVFR